MAVQNAVAGAQIPVAMAVLIFFQNFSTAVAGVISNVIFAQTLTAMIPIYAPSVSPAAALSAGSGADAVRSIVPSGHEDELTGLLRVYSDGLRDVFYFLAGLASLAFMVSFGIGWVDVRKQKQDRETREPTKKGEA